MPCSVFALHTIYLAGLTTHNMQDAAELCDRVAFIVNGRICVDAGSEKIKIAAAFSVQFRGRAWRIAT